MAGRNGAPRLNPNTPAFGHRLIDSPPYLPTHNRDGVALVGDCAMGTTRDHRKCAEECVAMARASDDDQDKVLWLTLAQSWVRLAEHVARSATAERGAHGREDVFAAHSSD